MQGWGLIYFIFSKNDGYDIRLGQECILRKKVNSVYVCAVTIESLLYLVWRVRHVSSPDPIYCQHSVFRATCNRAHKNNDSQANTRCEHNAGLMLARVVDDGPALIQHSVNVLCLLGVLPLEIMSR